VGVSTGGAVVTGGAAFVAVAVADDGTTETVTARSTRANSVTTDRKGTA